MNRGTNLLLACLLGITIYNSCSLRLDSQGMNKRTTVEITGPDHVMNTRRARGVLTAKGSQETEVLYDDHISLSR